MRSTELRITDSVPIGPLPDPLGVDELLPRIQWAAAPNGMGTWVITDYTLGRKILSDPRFRRDAVADSQATKLSPSSPASEAIISVDGREHSRLRSFVARAFTEHRISKLEPFVEQLVGQLLDDLEAQGPPADFISRVAAPLPFGVLCHLLGVPVEDREIFGSWVNVLFRLDSDGTDNRKHSLGLTRYMMKLVMKKRRNPGNDLISELVRPTARKDGATDRELVTLCLTLLMAGYESTIDQVGLCVLTLALDPSLLTSLSRDTALVPQVTEELVRLNPSAYISFPRVPTEPVTIDATTIEAGQPVIVFLMGSNRDPSVFPSPDRVKTDASVPPHLTFGHGTHRCLGASLARLQLVILLREMVTRFPDLSVAGDVDSLIWKSGMATRGLAQLNVSW